MKRCVYLYVLSFSLLGVCPLSSSILKKPPVKAADLTYKDLVCTQQDQAVIYEIISTMADNSKLCLLFKKSHLEQLGSLIDHVHPLKFLSTIFSDAHLKNCMISVWDDRFKKSGFLNGLAPSLTREASKGK